MITSNRNPTVRAAQELTKRRDRQLRQQFLIEGGRELRRALGAEVVLDQLFVSPARLRRDDDIAVVETARANGTTVIEVSDEVLAKLAYRAETEPMVAVASMFSTSLSRLRLPARPLILVMAEVEKPGNIGAMLRTAAAAGVDAVIVADPVADVFNPNVVRASVGALFTVAVAVASSDETMAWLARQGVAIMASSPDGGKPHWEVPLIGPSAIVVGAEHDGLSSVWLERAEGHLTIPMTDEPFSGADSMNVATAAAVLLFEAIRQRSLPG